MAVTSGACTSKRNAKPVQSDLSFYPLADGDEYLQELGQAFHELEPPSTIRFHDEAVTSDRLPPLPIVVYESPELDPLREEFVRVFEDRPDLLPAERGYKVLYERTLAYESPHEPPAPVWRAHIAATKGALHSSAAEASVHYPDGDDEYGSVSIYFSKADGEAFESLTTLHEGRRIAIARNDIAYSVPVVQEPIPGGQVMITPGGDALSERKRNLDEIFAELTGAPQKPGDPD